MREVILKDCEKMVKEVDHFNSPSDSVLFLIDEMEAGSAGHSKNNFRIRRRDEAFLSPSTSSTGRSDLNLNVRLASLWL